VVIDFERRCHLESCQFAARKAGADGILELLLLMGFLAALALFCASCVLDRFQELQKLSFSS
jgi:hypothetical protein